MLKKRLIFTLLFDCGNYVLSRNFRLQRVGDLRWLQKNYVFSRIAFAIDELIVLNVSRESKNDELFREHIRQLSKECFIPIAAGGGIRSVEQARDLLRSGADKVVLNTVLYEDKDLVYELARLYGRQCLVASVDIKMENGSGSVWVRNGSLRCDCSPQEFLRQVVSLPIGELYLNSINRDGTGQGYHFELLDLLPESNEVPVILAGGAGHWHHLKAGLEDPRVDAVATAHLFNFVGNGLLLARKFLLDNGIELARWPEQMED